MKSKNEFKILKIIMTITVILILCIFLWQIAPLMTKLSTKEGQIAFKNKINTMGFRGILLLFGLQVVQILLVILPGEPFEVLAGMCYGAWGGYLFITISVFITNLIVFFTVRKLGKKYLYNFFQKERVEKVMKSKLFKNPRNIELVLFIIFFLPASPKDLFVYIGGLLPIKPARFIAIATFARFPSVITSTMVGAHISNGNWKTSLIIYGISFIVAISIIYFVNLKDKNKEFIEIMK